MYFNKTIPELSVFDIRKSKKFYIGGLGAKIVYERPEDKFVFLSLEGNQLMNRGMAYDPGQTVKKGKQAVKMIRNNTNA